ncbi:OmpA family protein [Wenzhouxiangella limi]|uniref:Tandem-95 repeat protein n=1 Tax=Wenzhouxiangella limi TaxID=2707351 RepID=A0A845V2Y4_9GAMM|nr:OmpA family protein [Wenzhouxiangella limi]NDY96630.1 tandem-95 repeat protein [Wenzhouxiangella limi]
MKKLLLAAMVAVSGNLAAQVDAQPEDQARAMNQSPTLTFAGDRYRVGVGIDTEFDFIGEFTAALTESPSSALIGEGWLGRKSAGGLKLNYHWLFGGSSELGPDGPVYTDGRVAKLFVAADQNQHDDRKLTLGAGYEYEDWFMSLYGMRALTDERLVNRAVDLSEITVRGELDGRGFTRIDQLERVTELFEKPFDWGVGLRAGRYYDDRLLRLRGGLDYENGDFGNTQLTASFTADRFFAGTPHGLSLRTGWAVKRGDLVEDRNDLRASLVYSYSFGGNHRPVRVFREQAVEVMPEPRFEERAVATEVTLSDQATFGLDSAELRSGARETLSELLGAIREGRLVGRIQVVGHTCDLGPAAYNQRLSERRAQSVVDYLRSAGIEADEITWEGRGESEPRYPNDSEENRSRNRRVEIAFVTEQSRTERVQVSPEGPITEMRQVEVPVEAPWIRRALRNPVQHKREVDTYRFEEVTDTITEGEVVLDNQPPQASDSSFSVEQDSTDNRLDVLANDSDPDGDALTIVDVTSPGNGEAVISGDAVLYTPAEDFFGTDQFSYTIDDGLGGQAMATVTVSVDRANLVPEANDISFSVEQDSSDNRLDVLDNDSDPDGDTLTVVDVSSPANGEAVISGDAVLYTPAPEFSGTDEFTYTVDDGFGGQATATVTVTVRSANQSPQANDVSASTQRTQVVDIDVLASASDPDGDRLQISDFDQPANGSVVQSGELLRYQPDQLFFGEDTFNFTVDDGRGGQATAQVVVSVAFANQAPVAQPDAASGPPGVPITVDVLANDSDPDGDPLEIIDVVRVTSAGAETTINDDGTISFSISASCNGFNLFRYTVRDPFGATATANVTVRRESEESGTESNLECFL